MAKINIPEDNKLPDKSRVERRVTIANVPKKNAIEKAAGLIFAEDLDKVKGSIVDDYIAPRANDFIKDAVRKGKRFIVDSVTGAVEIILFGKSQSRNNYSYGDGRVTYTRYDSYYGDPRDSYDAHANNYYSSEILRRDFTISKYEDAKEVLLELNKIIKRYGHAKVADYYDLCGIPTKSVDYDRGWFDLVGVPDPIPVKDGYILDLPKPVALG